MWADLPRREHCRVDARTIQVVDHALIAGAAISAAGQRGPAAYVATFP
jgi:hypothetical protein